MKQLGHMCQQGLPLRTDMEDKVCDGCRYLGSEDALKGHVPDRCMKTERVMQVRPGMASSSFLRRPDGAKNQKIIKLLNAIYNT